MLFLLFLTNVHLEQYLVLHTKRRPQQPIVIPINQRHNQFTDILQKRLFVPFASIQQFQTHMEDLILLRYYSVNRPCILSLLFPESDFIRWHRNRLLLFAVCYTLLRAESFVLVDKLVEPAELEPQDLKHIVNGSLHCVHCAHVYISAVLVPV